MINDILIKRPFVRPMPQYIQATGFTRDPKKARTVKDTTLWQTVSQGQFIREYYPSGHFINDPAYYPDRTKYDEEKKVFYTEKVVRCSFPLQMIITAQHLVHIAGNDIRHELTDSKIDKEVQDLFLEWQKGWFNENIETRLYFGYKSAYIVGECAILFYLKDRKAYTKNLSPMTGDTLYPHFDSITGKLDAFARKFSDYDEENNEYVQWLEVWDEKYLRRYRRDVQGVRGAITKVKELFGLEGWVQVGKDEAHGFERVPVAYHRREEGACWSFVQDAIDKYELAVSYLCQNNMAYAFPIMVLQGDNVDIQGDIYGQVKAITGDADSKISYLERSDNTAAFELQLNTLLRQIFLGSFAVMPPEVKSGDLPGVAIKLIYSPSLDRAMIDAKEFDHFIDDVQELFTHAYGVQQGKISQYKKLNILSYIVPYIHQNTAELINNLVQATSAGILSHETASELTTYDRNAEYQRITREAKEEQQADLLYQQLKKTNNTAA
ncbi:MAG: phage portal protein [Paramuribaculum sp.]|nr:phage portal protein [Paramuribaculum sp.]